MDERLRSFYDKTGRILGEDDAASCNDVNGESPFSNGKAPRRGRGTHSQDQWEQFFQSIFNEIISTGSHHATAATSYRGSAAEKKDVLHYYTMCRGDLNKVVECILHGNADDVVRWKREIIDPEVASGKMAQFSNEKKCDDGKQKSCSIKKRRRILEDSSSEEDEEMIKVSRSNKKRLGRSKPRQNALLIDTDDEGGDDSSPQRQYSQSNTSTSSSSMSKRDKMDFRVARKRKAKAEKEMQMADIIQSKNWDIGAAADDHSQRRRSKKEKNMGGISDALLSNIEKKYGSRNKNNKKKKD